MTADAELAAGARNLLVDCAGLKAGEKLLIVQENPQLGWYDEAAPEAVAVVAEALGMVPERRVVGAPGEAADPAVAAAMADHDCTLFFARIGDQDRFAEPVPGKTSVMCYARDAAMLASAYGRTPHQAMKELKGAVDAVLAAADRIEITCPLGTRCVGGDKTAGDQAGDVGILRFPLGVPTPMRASSFSGRVALAHYLTPTGSQAYKPAFLKIEQTVFAGLANGRIVDFEGNAADVTRIRAHYQQVADKFAIDRDAVDSWHAGIHPGCAYHLDAAADPDHWSNTVFTNPRFLHFHTCGAYPPGEICWMVLDPTVAVDGINLWDGGRLCPQAFPQTAKCLEAWPEFASLFAAPSDFIGLDTDDL